MSIGDAIFTASIIASVTLLFAIDKINNEEALALIILGLPLVWLLGDD